MPVLLQVSRNGTFFMEFQIKAIRWIKYYLPFDMAEAEGALALSGFFTRNLNKTNKTPNVGFKL